jgi:acyl carrier protein
MSLLNEVKEVIISVLQIDDSKNPLDANSNLLGAIPEFDSMAVVSIITTLEEQYGFYVEDDEISAEIFETVDSLVTFVEEKVKES